MISVLLCQLVMGQAPPVLTFRDGQFDIAGPATSIKVPAQPPESISIFPADRLTLTYSGRDITLDRSGIGVKAANGRVDFSRLPAVATSNRLFSLSEIASIRSEVAAGRRTEGFNAVSGYEYIGSTLYLLLRWEESDRKPWLEALVAYDMSQPTLQARLVGRVSGFSYANGTVDDRLENIGGDLAAVTQKDGEWGVARWSISQAAASWSSFGPAPATVRMQPGAPRAFGLKPTAYGTTVVTVAHLDTGQSFAAAEVRGSIKGILQPSYLDWKEGSQKVLRNLETGAELRPYWDSQAVHTSAGLLVWWPAVQPRRATLYDADTFRPLSTWVTQTPPPSARPAAVKPAPAKAQAKPVAPAKPKTAAKPASRPTARPVARPAARPASAPARPKPKATAPKASPARPARRPASQAAPARRAPAKPATSAAKPKVKVSVRPSPAGQRGKATVEVRPR